MRLMLATLLTVPLATPAVAQSAVPPAGGVAFSDFKTYWAEKRESCQPMIAFKVKNAVSANVGPIGVHMEVVDTDTKSVFARGVALVPSFDLPPGQTKEITIGGDHDITSRDCLGDMHEMAFATIHFAIRLTATVGQDPVSREIVHAEPMTEERVPAQD